MPFGALIDDEPAWLVGKAAADTWRRAQEVKAEGRVRCRGCGAEMRTRTSKAGTRHFYHKVSDDSCLLSEAESKEHIAAKLAVAEAIEASGGVALVEDIAQDRSFIVDATGEWTSADGSTRRVAFEVQCSPQNGDTTRLRNRQRKAECDLTVWVLYRRSTGDEDAGLDLRGWALPWAPEIEHLRLHEDLTTVGLVAHEMDDESAAPIPAWRPSTLQQAVGAIGQNRCAWLPGRRFQDSGGWVTARLAYDLDVAIREMEERLAEAERQKEKQRRQEAAREAQRRENEARLEAENRHKRIMDRQRKIRDWVERRAALSPEALAAERQQVVERLTRDLTAKGAEFVIEPKPGWAGSTAVRTEGMRLLVVPDAQEVSEGNGTVPGREILLVRDVEQSQSFRGLQWLSHYDVVTRASRRVQHRRKAKRRERQREEKRRDLARGARRALLERYGGDSD